MIRSRLESRPGQSLRILDDIPTPSLVIDDAILRDNLGLMASRAAGNDVALWPHAKTHRFARLGRMQLEAGAAGLTVAKLGEAEAFAATGATDLIVAYPLVGDDLLLRARALRGRMTSLAFGVDSREGAEAASRVFARFDERADVYLLIDSGLGREGVRGDEALQLADLVIGLPGLRLRGILTHEGSVYGAASRTELEELSRGIARTMVDLGRRIESELRHPVDVSLGASASAPFVVDEPGVTSLRPGMYAINDLGLVALGVADFENVAARVLTTVVSSPRPGVACIDAGSKVLGLDPLTASAFRDELPGHGWIADLPGWSIARLSEEHGWLRWEGAGSAPRLEVGRRLQVIPNHICMTIFSSGQAGLVREGRYVEQWDAFDRTTSR